MTIEEHEVTAEFLKQYYKVYGNTEVSQLESAFDVQLPTFEKFVLDIDSLDFEAIESELGVSGKLYLYSGEFLTLINADSQTTQNIVGKFISWIQSVQDARARSYDSWDHATSLRIETLVFLRQTSPSVWPETGDELLTSDIEWALDTKNIKLNNHGVFVLRSLLLASKCLPEHFMTDLVLSISQVFQSRMLSILDYVYGTDGWCAENSPMYDRVWINLLRQLLRQFPDQIESSGVKERFEHILELADVTSRTQIYHGGHYVPRGDTPRRRTTLEPHYGTHWSQRVGIWTYSSNALYLMATAGHASITHKHVDDLQLLLSYRRVDFFMDAGTAGYDYRNPKVSAIKAPAGHSVLTTQSVTDLKPWQAYKRGPRTITAELELADFQHVRMVNRISEEGTLSRQVAVIGDHHMVVSDSWALENDDGTVLLRFLLADTCFISVKGKTVTLMRLGQKLAMTFSEEIEIQVISGEQEPPYRGWYTVNSRDILRGYCLEIKPMKKRSSGMLSYTINMGQITDEEALRLDRESAYKQGGLIST